MEWTRPKKLKDIATDPKGSDHLCKLGSIALKTSLIRHLPATSLLSDLLDANLSRHNLTQVALRLESKGLILLMKVRDTGKDTVEEDGRLCMDDYGIGIATDTDTDPPLHQLWEMTMTKMRRNGSEPIKRIAMREMGSGFRKGMANYALQVAGLMYMEGDFDLCYFWEKYKEHMEPMIRPEDLEDRREAARTFEAEMKSVTEGVPRYLGMYVKNQ